MKHITKPFILLTLTMPMAQPSSDTTDPVVDIEPVADSDFYRNGEYPPAMVELGRQLFFDRILSGNNNIACATCHHPRLGTTDGLALSLGEGAVGLGPDRKVNAEQPVAGRVPRNAQDLFFVGAREYERMFHDGRVEKEANLGWASGFWSPAREQLPAGLDNVLAAQAMFPVTSAVEMAGQKGENPVATAAALDELAGTGGVWELLARRLRAVPEYERLFKAAFTHVSKAADIRFVDAANAIAAFETVAFRADNSPFDQYLRTRDLRVLNPQARRGMDLFYGRANCAGCHGGKLQSDHHFHAIAMPQIGPGKNDGWDQSYWQATGYMARLEDHGRGRETQRTADKYRFRTPSLRNVELTAPYGHAGAYTTLEQVIAHHADPAAALENYRAAEAPLTSLQNIIETTALGSRLIHRPVNPNRLADYLKRDTWVVQSAALRGAIANANELEPVNLSKAEITDLVAFLKSLTDPGSRDLTHLVPKQVPSGLPLER